MSHSVREIFSLAVRTTSAIVLGPPTTVIVTAACRGGCPNFGLVEGGDGGAALVAWPPVLFPPPPFPCFCTAREGWGGLGRSRLGGYLLLGLAAKNFGPFLPLIGDRSGPWVHLLRRWLGEEGPRFGPFPPPSMLRWCLGTGWVGGPVPLLPLGRPFCRLAVVVRTTCRGGREEGLR